MLGNLKRGQAEIMSILQTEASKTLALQVNLNTSLQNQRDMAEKFEVFSGDSQPSQEEQSAGNQSTRGKKSTSKSAPTPRRSGKLGVCTG
jgi:hypothetical protein